MKRYKHNLSYYNLLTCDMGQLVPIGLTEALPGDTFQHHTNMLIRISPMAAPIMHNITARVHHFFVPHRLVWDQWEDFITGGPDGNDVNVVPKQEITVAGWDANTLFDYLGIPKPDEDTEVNALPIRGFNLIYNEYYRDQDLVPERPIGNTVIPNIAWEKDYFTTARPWTQKGPDVTVPIGEYAPVIAQGISDGERQEYGIQNEQVYADTDPTYNGPFLADLANATATNVNDWRKAFALQRYQEARARYGSRYVEYLRYLGVRPRDERLQRPEFLGGGTAQLQISEILQTAPEIPGASPPSSEFGVGDMYGHGVGAMRSNAYRRTMDEHGYVFTMLSVRPKSVYANALDRHWIRTNKEDYFQRELQHVGQQEIYNNEIYFGHSQPDGVFGYQDRYAEYRSQHSRVCGEYRDLLNYWHMAREFANEPVLNQEFVDCVPTKRIHNEQTLNALWIAAQHKLVARRLVDRSAVARIY